MKITVIIPVYNRLEHLRAGFLCLLAQERQPDELIITDDGSSENILDFIGDLIPKSKFKIKHIYQEDKGFRKTRALNNAVRNCEGELLIFCDQDLIFGEDYIEIIEKNIQDNIFLMGRAHHITKKEKEKILLKMENEYCYNDLLNMVPPTYPITIKKMLNDDKKRRLINFFKLNKRGIKLVGMSYALMKKSYIKVNGYDEKYNGWGEEDDDFGNRLTVAGIKGKELVTNKMQMHLWHYTDETKKYSNNEKYYNQRKKEIFKNKDFFCEFGYNNSIDNDKIKIEILK